MSFKIYFVDQYEEKLSLIYFKYTGGVYLEKSRILSSAFLPRPKRNIKGDFSIFDL